jgi:regulator of protease activity HflC (stomatin/prohibitin superfamily)
MKEVVMATIRHFPLVNHLSGAPTRFVIHSRAGRVRHSGPGVAFWFRPLSAAISEVPVDDRELPLVAHARTADLQDVTVAVTVSFRFVDPPAVAQHIDFGIDPVTGRWSGTPLEQVDQLLTESATGLVMDALAAHDVAAAVAGGAGDLAASVSAGLQHDERLARTGISVLGARVKAVRAEPDLERALQAPAREETQTRADAAIGQRRALAVERERAIAEYELANRIELAIREADLVAQEGANARQRAAEAAAAALVETTARVERDTLVAAAQADRTRGQGRAEADAQAARLHTYDGISPAVLQALALQDLAANLPAIGQLTVTPDVLTGALAALTAGRRA